MDQQITTTLSVEALKKLLQSVSVLRQSQRRRPRSTFSQGNAREFLRYLTVLADNPVAEVVIPASSHNNCKLTTLYQKWSGALQYFVEATSVPQEQKVAAAIIKTATIARIDTENKCLRITARTGGERTPRETLKKAEEIIAERRKEFPSVEWKEQFLEWVAAGETGVPYIHKGLALSTDDIEFVRSLCEAQNWDHDISHNVIKCCKF